MAFCFPAFLALAFAYPFTLFVTHSRAEAFNHTIDDQDSLNAFEDTQITYSPSWVQGSQCAGCKVRPNASLAFGHTWHDTTATTGDPSTVNISFRGTAIYVYFILDNHPTSGITTVTYFNVTLDGQSAGNFGHNPNGTAGFVYNALVYSTENLLYQNHTISLFTNGSTQQSLMLFDYAIYTTPHEPAASSSLVSQSTSGLPTVTITSPTASSILPASGSTTSAGMIAGAVIGALSGVGLIARLAVVMLRRRHQSTDESFRCSTTDSKQAPDPPTISHVLTTEADSGINGASDDLQSMQRRDYNRMRTPSNNAAIMERMTELQAAITRLQDMHLHQANMLRRIIDPPDYDVGSELH